MISEAYVWIWLPDSNEPVVCGRIEDLGQFHEFNYDKSYRQRPGGIALDHLELPLDADLHRSRHLLQGVIRDAAPDAWGRRVLMLSLGLDHERADAELRELDHLVQAGGDRVGALHVQESPDEYSAPTYPGASLSCLIEAVELLEASEPLPSELKLALLHGASVGGARPKALLDDRENRRLIAKFSSVTDAWPVVRCEFLGMRLAAEVGLNVAPVELIPVGLKDVLLVERFDRVAAPDRKFTRRHFFSALTALGLSEDIGRYASYPDFADFLAKYSASPKDDCRELYRRMVFNMVIGNTDDHARNHAVFWDGTHARLTPAYDIGIIRRIGQTGSQAMAVGAEGNRSTLSNALSSCARFLLSPAEAQKLTEEICDVVSARWRKIANEASISPTFANQLAGTAILSPLLFAN